MAALLRALAVLLVTVAGTLVWNNDVVKVSAQCGGSLPGLISQCGQYVEKTGPTIPPSPACCTELRKLDMKCACNLITNEIVNLISIPKAIFVVRSCGINLPPGTKCGAITVPGKR